MHSLELKLTASYPQPPLHRQNRSNSPPIKPTAPEPSATPETDPMIDVEAEVTGTPATDEPHEPTPTSDIEVLLNKMSLADIRKLAKAKGADARGNRVNIGGEVESPGYKS
jgi:hypothetical protein